MLRRAGQARTGGLLAPDEARCQLRYSPLPSSDKHPGAGLRWPYLTPAEEIMKTRTRIIIAGLAAALTFGAIGTAVAESGGSAAAPVVAMGTHHYE